jgi:hypothetical protein
MVYYNHEGNGDSLNKKKNSEFEISRHIFDMLRIL